MARGGPKNELIKCEYCGEMYSVTYKHCPFCNEDGTGRWDDLENGADYDLDDEYEDIPESKGERDWQAENAAAADTAAPLSDGSSPPSCPWPLSWRRCASSSPS